MSPSATGAPAATSTSITPSITPSAAEDLREQLFAHTRHLQAVWSLDGREVEFVVGFESGAEVGGFVTVTTPAGRRLVVQVQELGVSERTGANVDVDAARLGMDETLVRSANVDLVVRRVRGRGVVLGELVADLDELSLVFSHVPKGMIAESRSFQLGEMLAAGPVAPTPMRLRMGGRWTPEGGADLPTTWARP